MTSIWVLSVPLAACLATLADAQAMGKGKGFGRENDGEKDCEYNKGGFIFYRMLILKKDSGLPQFNISRDDFESSLANCIDMDEQIGSMLEFFRVYGVTLGDFADAPFEPYSGENVRIETYGSSDWKLVMSSLFDFTKFSNRAVYDVGWKVTTTVEIETNDGDFIPIGSSLRFGVYGVHLHGRDFCIKYANNGYSPPVHPETTHIAVDTNLHSYEWGSGAARGTYIKRESRESEEEGTWDHRLVLTFPADSD